MVIVAFQPNFRVPLVFHFFVTCCWIGLIRCMVAQFVVFCSIT